LRRIVKEYLNKTYFTYFTNYVLTFKDHYFFLIHAAAYLRSAGQQILSVVYFFQCSLLAGSRQFKDSAYLHAEFGFPLAHLADLLSLFIWVTSLFHLC